MTDPHGHWTIERMDPDIDVAGVLEINAGAFERPWSRTELARELARVLDTAERAGATGATLEVRRSNISARRLYGCFGFAVAGTRPDYNANPREDALILWHGESDSP